MKKLAILTLVLALLVFPSACSVSGAEPSASTPTAAVATPAAPSTSPAGTTTASAGTVDLPSAKWSSDDLDSGWSTVGATLVTLEGDSIQVDGTGATVDGTTVTFVTAGTYIISGSLADGQIRVDSLEKGTVKLVLNGVDIACSTSSPIYVLNADKVVLTLADGSANRVEDGEAYVPEDTESDEPGAAIFSHDDLTINGSGSLVVVANYNHGIQSKDDLKIAGGTISIEAANDGMKGRDSVSVRDGIITVNAGGDGKN